VTVFLGALPYLLPFAVMGALAAAASGWHAWTQPHRARSREQWRETMRRRARDTLVRILLWRLPGGTR
jgi:acyl-CoA reductase-like NAD-dependent aldehyde dehydrogenase